MAGDQDRFVLLVVCAIPLFALLIGVEAFVTRKGIGRGYYPKDTLASLAIGLSYLGGASLTKGATFALLVGVHEYAPFNIPNAWAWLPLAIVAEDFTVYWLHRANHRIRLFWAGHMVHHSSRYLNLGTAVRFSAAGPFYEPVFYIPMALVGFDPTLVLMASGINLIYGFFVHTELFRSLGFLELFMVTPSHHRVHHGRNEPYLNKNYGVVFIVWDRLFGTFQKEEHAVDFGLVENIHSYNPIRITFHEWRALARDVFRAQRWRDRLEHLLRPPGWTPEPALGVVESGATGVVVPAAPAARAPVAGGVRGEKHAS